MRELFPENTTPRAILRNALTAFVSLFINGIGVYLTIHAGIGSAPWDVLNLGIANSFGILYGNVSIAVSFTVLFVDVLMREPIGIAIVIDAVTVGKTVDLFNYLDLVPAPRTVWGGIVMTVIGLFILGYTQYFYMRAALGCGPRDTLMLGLSRQFPKVPIGVICVAMQSTVTLVGWLLGGPVGIGTLLCAFGAGPIMQFAFRTVGFNATDVVHQNFAQTAGFLFKRKEGQR